MMLVKIKQSILFLCFSSMLLLSTIAAAANFTPLPEDKAYQLSVSYIRPNVVMAQWQIAPGYYLYTDRTQITFSPERAIDIQYPKGTVKKDEEHGRYEVYSKSVSVSVTLPADYQPTTMTVHYQGCSKNGFCYPPTDKYFMVNAAAMTVTEISDIDAVSQATPSISSLLTDQNNVGAFLQRHQQLDSVMLLIFMGLGLLLAFTPCVLPMIPILTSIIVGQQHAPGTKKAFLLSLAYVLGMSITYAMAGMAAASLGGSLQVWLQKPVTIAIVSGLFVALALSLFGLYELRFSRRWQNKISVWSNKHEGGTYAGVFFMGVLATLVVSPCVTAPLVGVLIYIGQTGDLMFGAGALFAMGIGMGIPLLLIGMSAGRWLPKSGPWMKAVKELFGFFMVAMAIWLLSRIVSPSVTKILFAALLLGGAAFVGLYLPRLIRFRKVNQLIGTATAIFGMLLMFNGVTTNGMIAQEGPSAGTQAFTVVHNMKELNEKLMLAQSTSQPVILDFYADWCASCVAMDRGVFSRNGVQQALGGFMLLRADMSGNTKADSEMLKHFDVIAPPTVLFFNNSGREVNSRRIVGELNATEFLTRLNSFMTASCDKKVQC